MAARFMSSCAWRKRQTLFEGRHAFRKQAGIALCLAKVTEDIGGPNFAADRPAPLQCTFQVCKCLYVYSDCGKEDAKFVQDQHLFPRIMDRFLNGERLLQ